MKFPSRCGNRLGERAQDWLAWLLVLACAAGCGGTDTQDRLFDADGAPESGAGGQPSQPLDAGADTRSSADRAEIGEAGQNNSDEFVAPDDEPVGSDAGLADAGLADAELGDAELGDAAPDAAANDAQALSCPVFALSGAPRSARSSGYSGTANAYYALYDEPCQTPTDCTPACVTAGGTEASCVAGMACTLDSDRTLRCLPPTYWLYTESALSESGSTALAAQVVLVDIDYDDALVFSDFDLALPADATIHGIEFTLDRNADGTHAVDGAVRILKAGAPVGTDQGRSEPWPSTLTPSTYGAWNDTWGTTWSAADLAASGFGFSIAPRYTGPTAGNDRAHVDSANVTVYYSLRCLTP